MSTAGHEVLHPDVAGYALGTLEPDERARFEAHLAGCPVCRDELSRLAPVASLVGLATGPLPVPPAALRARALAAVEDTARERAAGHGPRPLANGSAGGGTIRNGASEDPGVPRWTPGNGTLTREPAPATAARARRGTRRRGAVHGRRFALAAAAVAAVLAVLLVGGGLERSDLPGGDPGPLEAVASLEAPDGGQQATLDVFFTGIGRVVELDTDDLPILPTGEYYELWFVGPDDRPGAPDRISAGTFHPDEDGRSRVTFAAAVDPAKYPVLAITAEPGDGDPAPSGADVLRGESRLRESG